MAAKKPLGLGKGLSAIFETETQNIEIATVHSWEIELKKIKPNESQPRTQFDEEAIAELAESIKCLGVIQPITIREVGGRYEIISGERRYRASIVAGLTTIPAYVRKVDDAKLLEMALVENIQREELGALEIALTLRRLTEELGVTQEALAKSVGKRRSTVANYLRLLTLCPVVQEALRGEEISMGHAKVIASIESAEEQEKFLAKIISAKLSVRAAEDLLAKSLEPKATKKAAGVDYSDFYEELSQVFGKKNVKIEGGAKGNGKISIKFASALELSQIVKRLGEA
ncbi:MAG: ParB/RepB/Spo0J family partition protein [Rikenellaceae bacterium]